MKIKEIIVTSIISSIIATASLFAMTMVKGDDVDLNEKISQYYTHEVATNVSAHGLRKKLDEGNNDFILVDVRSEEEYLEGHIIGAISIPAYTDRDNTQNVSNERILEAFQSIDSSKDIITYCYSSYCMTSRKIGKYLADNGVFVQHLTVGWNEWRYGWELWNYPHEEDMTEKYIFSGTGSGAPESSPESDSCGISGDFGC